MLSLSGVEISPEIRSSQRCRYAGQAAWLRYSVGRQTVRSRRTSWERLVAGLAGRRPGLILWLADGSRDWLGWRRASLSRPGSSLPKSQNVGYLTDNVLRVGGDAASPSTSQRFRGSCPPFAINCTLNIVRLQVAIKLSGARDSMSMAVAPTQLLTKIVQPGQVSSQ